MSGNKRITSPDGLKTAEKVREICSRFPSVEEKIDGFGHLSFRVKDKPFIIMGENEEGIGVSLKTSTATQEILLQSKPDAFIKTAYIGHHGWVSIRKGHTPDWTEISELAEEAYLRTAPKSLIKNWPK